MSNIASYLFCLAAGIFLARFELHSDDAGVETGLVLAATFVLGCLRPRHAWQWALLVGLWIPAAELIFRRPPDNASAAAVTGFVLAVGLVGSYLGALVRRGLSGQAAR